MPYTVEGKLVVAISSRALFDFEDENRVFERDGEGAYIALQYARLDVPAREGVAFPLVKKLLAFNTPGQSRVEVVVLSKNDPVSGLRVFRSAKQAGLNIERGVFTRGRSPYHYLDPLKANLFLSANEADVMGALEAKVLSVSYPPNEAALVWQVAASESGSARVRISSRPRRVIKPGSPGPAPTSATSPAGSSSRSAAASSRASIRALAAASSRLASASTVPSPNTSSQKR